MRKQHDVGGLEGDIVDISAHAETPWELMSLAIFNVIRKNGHLNLHQMRRVVEDLPEEYRTGATRTPPPRVEEPVAGESLTMDEIERQAILEALDKTGGNRTRAAEMLGIGLRTLQRKLKEYRLAGKDS